METRDAAMAEQQRVFDRCRHPDGGFSPLELPRPERLLALFEQRAAELGPRLALQKGGDRLSFARLNEDANRLARLILARMGEAPEPIALLFDSGPAAVTAMLAVWKTGKSFVMLDPATPPERLAAILADAGARLLVAEPCHVDAARAVSRASSTALLEGEAEGDLAAGNLGIDPAPGALACLVYTSGTTGRPKGVMVGYACLAGRVLTVANRSRTGRHDREGIVRSGAFIGSIGVLLNALVAGASAHFFDFRASGPGGLRDFLAGEEITILSPGVSLFRQLVATLRATDAFPKLRLIRLAGEQVLTEDLRLARRHFAPGCVVRIGYSSTEASAIADYFADHSTPEAEPGPAAPCGYPPPDVEVLIRGADGRELGVGEPGEIEVRAAALAQGYWRRPEETAARFLPDPAGGARRWFRTGDVGTRLPNGMLVVMGRADAQVKVRGHRVEPADVEAALLACPGVQAVAVTARADGRGQPGLVAYVVCTGARPTVTALRSALAARLPDYMLPRHLVFVGTIPLTLNGKVDWRALPAPPAGRPALAAPFVAPRGPLETLVAGIWQEVLGVEPIGVQDAFLDLGGDSLAAARIVTLLQPHVPLDLPVQALLAEAGTVEAMAAQLVRAHEGPAA